MKALSEKITQLAFGKSDEVPLTNDEQKICEEWTSGEAAELMKVDATDPRVLEYVGLYNKLESKKDEVWESIEAAHSLTQSAQQEIPVLQQPTARIGRRTWMLAAAVLTTSIVGVYALYQFINNDKHNVVPTQGMAVAQKAIEPGRVRAVLTLADNSQIDLETLPAGVVAYQEQMEINKQKDNQIVYKVSAHRTGAKALNNTLTTPYGGEYKVTLADGSIVWLNAGSSLKYPTAFEGNDRVVEIIGEGYFEVAHNKAKPFHVMANGTEVKVLGTKFNVRAYETDKQVTTTLVTGAVAVQHGAAATTIKPNQQAIVSGDNIAVKNKNQQEMLQALAWKNGLINLEGESVKSILEQIKRWYNVDTQIEAGTTETTSILTGTVERSQPLSKVLELLNTNLSVRFTLQDHTVVAKEKNK
ncbi:MULTISPECIES: FecR family protein [Niastella]|uniref:FecR domain-containing protein n=1 Tax=Niastella soli TaxID=2821487 RepID=A0ABS3Z4T5_9BACT|nr:FecR family protein [Niastella soli]MBO9205158.1 FecR domain-containing protein [Niastella soli]